MLSNLEQSGERLMQLEKVKERNVDIHMNFIDFKSAFDTIWRKTLWKMMKSIGIIVRIIKKLQQDTECAAVIDRNLTKWLNVLDGGFQF